MALTQMPNGQYVDVPDNISPEGLARVQQQNAAPAARRGQPAAAPQQTVAQKRADQYEKLGFGHGMLDSVTKGLSFGFGDELGGAAAGAMAIPGAIIHGDASRISKAYTEERDTQRELDKRYEEAHPVASTASEIGGALLNPLGAGEGVLAAGGRVAARAGAGRVAARLAAGSERVAQAGAIPQAVLAGANQGALNAAGNADEISDVPGALVRGGGIGGLTGGALGAVGHAGARGVQILSDASKANAERTAYSRVAQLLENGGTDARKVQREIAVTDARGGDAMVADMTPGLRAQAGAISRKPSVPSSNELIERGENRIQDRRASFGEQVRKDADIPAIGDDALARGDQLQAGRKAQGQADYAKGGIMDTPITPTPALQKYLKDAPEEVQGALRGAYKEMLLRDEKPGDYIGPNDIFTHIPNLRTFDYVKRSFDSQIGQAIRAGDKPTAQGLSYQLDKLKGVLADANPNNAEYKAVLGAQRDAFQKQNALEIGQSVLKRMTSEPRAVLRDLKALEPHQVDDARVGIIDKLINSDTKADPVAAFRSMMRNESQRKVMEFAFGGKGNLGRFERYVNREVRATRADVLTAPGRQSETARFAMADSDVGEGAGQVLQNAMRGFAFGGAIGAVSGVSRTLQNIATGTTKVGQEEIAKILLSKGENLVKGTEAAAKFQAGRRVGNRNRGRNLGKGAQQIYTDQAGN